MSATTTRDTLHALIEALPDDALAAAHESLAALVPDAPPILSPDEYPLDDEPLSDEDLAAIAEARAQVERGDFITHEELLARRAARRGIS